MTGLTKLDVAQREINTAARLLFDQGDPVAVSVLASAARGIVAALCEAKGLRTFIDDIQNEFPDMTKSELHKAANRSANFFKHADKDPEAVLDEFTPEDADAILFTAVYDLGTFCGGKFVEAQVFEGWYLYKYGAMEDLPSGLDELFPKLRELPREDQLALGKKVLTWALTVKNFKMSYSVEVRLQPLVTQTP
jgi:hypothetical protein